VNVSDLLYVRADVILIQRLTCDVTAADAACSQFTDCEDRQLAAVLRVTEPQLMYDRAAAI